MDTRIIREICAHIAKAVYVVIVYADLVVSFTFC